MPSVRIHVVFAAALLGIGTQFRVAGAVDFNREVRPILSDACYHCHGPDEEARKAKLRLDTREGAFREKNGVAVIVPGKSGESELIKRITSSDPDEVMPPPDSNRKISQEQIAKLKQWVDEGAKWETHWAFLPAQEQKPPAVTGSGSLKNGIDHFIQARLQKEGIKPAGEANKATLLRRVSFDLTGVGPSVEELDRFLNDNSTNAYEKAVDRLLSSKRYGERMAADWLDIARYADTHGYQMDRYRAMWPYRDWVIKAFNENLSFDQFVTWQVAGDLLPNATKEQRLATAFNRLHLQNEEGGIVEEEYRVAYVVDRVNTFGTAFLGLTFECSRCHDHKYDPISMKDFYAMFSFFQNIDESGQTTYFTESMPVPTLILSDEATDAKLAELGKKIAEKEGQAASLHVEAKTGFEEWLQQRPTMDFQKLPGLVAQFDFEELKENKLPNRVNEKAPANAVEGPKLEQGRAGNSAQLNGENGFTFPGIGHFTRADPFTLSIWIKSAVHAERAVVVHHSKAPIDAGSRGYELLLEKGRVAFGLHHMWPGNSIKVTTREAIASNEWVHVAVTYDGSSKASGARVYVNGKTADLEVIRDGLYKDISYGGGEPDLAIGHRFRDSGFKGGVVDDFAVFDRALTPLEAAQLAGRDEFKKAWETPAAQLTADQRRHLLEYYVQNIYPIGIQFFADLRSLRQEQNRTVNPIPEVMVMKELPKPKPAHILKRGAYDAHGEAVSANTPAVLPPLPNDAPRNRLGLARWLHAPENPLMARVTVNRAWQQMFGRGLVETSDNFGSQGATPTHPELLDWLARAFIKSGWNMKGLLRLMATSATYRQSSKADAEVVARDPGNQLLARAPVRRLSAEMLRDHALGASGLLVEKIGGPSVKPYQPEGLWEEIAMGKPRYDTGKGDDLYRRSLYTFWKRTVPHPTMITFDAADRNVCAVKRQATSTPLQALALLNDPQQVEAARFLAQRMLKASSDRKGQLQFAFRMATGRLPNERESAVLQQLLEEQRAIFAADKAAAVKLLAIGERVSDQGLDVVDLAAGTVLAQAIFNHDESVMRR